MTFWRLWRACGALALCLVWPALVNAQQTDPATVDLRVTATRLSIEEFEDIVPALKQFNLPRSLKIDELLVEGPRNDLKMRLAIDSPSGAIKGTLEVNTMTPATRIRGNMRVDGANVAAVFEQPALPSELRGSVEFDLKSTRSGGRNRLSGTYRLDSPRVVAAGYAVEGMRASGRIDAERITVEATGRAYGAQVTTNGDVRLGSGERPVTYALTGRARGVELRRLPDRLNVPDLDTRLDFVYTLNGRGTIVDGNFELDPSMVSGAKVADGTKVTFSWNGRVLAYAATGSVVGLDLARVGREGSIEFLQRPRYSGHVSGRFDVAGRGSQLDKVTADLSDAKIFNGSLSGFHADLAWGEGTFDYTLDGAFRDISLAQILDESRTSGQLTGRLKVKGELPRDGYQLEWRGGSIAGDATLERSTVEDLKINTLAVAGRVADGVATLDRLDATGDARVKAAGRVVVEGQGESSFDYHVEAASTTAFKRFWSQLPDGAIVLDGKLTGPSHAPHFVGALTASSVRSGSLTALTAKSSYDATVPSFDIARLQIMGDTSATVVNVGRMTLPTVEGKWSYGVDGLTFEARTEDRTQKLDIAGGLRLNEGVQEWRLRRLTVTMRQTTWALAPSTEGVLKVHDGQVDIVEPITLAGQDQQVVFSGSLGDSGPLLARFENVDLAFLASWAGWPDAAGRLKATVEMRGRLDKPQIKAAFEVRSGAIRQYPFDNLTGTAEYENGGLRLDARVNQDAMTSVAIAGYVPVGTAEGAGESGARGLDITVRSDTIALAAIQSVTSSLTNVAGTARLDLRITGTLSDPIVVGTVDVKGGAFDVRAIGVRYNGLDTTIRFEPRSVVLSDFTLRDHDGHTIIVSGSLPAYGVAQGMAAIDVLVDNATVLDNDYGHLEVVGVMRITADPKWLVTASLEIRDGEVRVDRWLERRPRTVPARIEGVVATAAVSEAAEPAGLFADLPVDLDVRLNTEGLVLRGRNLRRNSPLSLGLGNVNVTTEGEMRFTKRGPEPVQIQGDLQMVRGTYAFQGREFEIDRGGTVRFTGGYEINPIINISGRRVITGVEAQVRITGTIREPRLALSSQPPLDEADILSLVVFDEPVSTLGASQQFSLAQRGAALAGGALTSEFSETLGEALDIDLFDFQVATTEAGVGGVFTIGERLGDKVFVKARQLFGPDSPTEVLLEYDISRRWRLQTSVAEDRARSRTYRRPLEKGSIDLKYSIRY